MSLADSVSGDTTLQDHPVLDYGPVVGFGLTLFAAVANWGISLEDADELVQFLTHTCFSVVAMAGAYKVLSPGTTKVWNWLRRRFA